jgi:hypothetical protein
MWSDFPSRNVVGQIHEIHPSCSKDFKALAASYSAKVFSELLILWLSATMTATRDYSVAGAAIVSSPMAGNSHL